MPLFPQLHLLLQHHPHTKPYTKRNRQNSFFALHCDLHLNCLLISQYLMNTWHGDVDQECDLSERPFFANFCHCGSTPFLLSDQVTSCSIMNMSCFLFPNISFWDSLFFQYISTSLLSLQFTTTSAAFLQSSSEIDQIIFDFLQVSWMFGRTNPWIDTKVLWKNVTSTPFQLKLIKNTNVSYKCGHTCLFKSSVPTSSFRAPIFPRFR